MTINTFKDLSKLIQICRKTGIQTFKVDGIEFTLGALPNTKQKRLSDSQIKQAYAEFDPGPVNTEQDIIPTDFPTEEQLLFGSSDPTVWKSNA